MLNVRKLIISLACLGLVAWQWPALKSYLPLSMTLEHGGLVGLYQADGSLIGSDPMRLRFHGDGAVDLLSGDKVVGAPMSYVVENGEVVIHQS